MMKTTLLLVILTLAASSAMSAPNAVTCEVSSLYYDSTAARPVPLSVDTATFYLGTRRVGFPVAFAVEAEVTSVDSHRVELTVHVTTAGATPRTLSKRFAVEYGLPAEIRQIDAKAGQDYRLRIVPIEAIEATPEPCTYEHTTRGLFKIFPAASMNIHYLPGSLAEFHQTLIRDVLQTRFKQFRLAFGLSLPGKYDVYACPCAVPSVLWDDRFAMATDPTRSLAFVIHATDFTSVDPFVVCHSGLLRHFGYAPPFLSEGFAGYFGLAVHDMRNLIENESHLSLTAIMPTESYMRAHPEVADRTASTFVRFLIDTYGLDRFRTLYDSAHDGNLLEQLSLVYETETEHLEQEWLTWVDTVTIPAERAHVAAEQAEVLRQYERMADNYEFMLLLATTSRDSSLALAGLSRAAYYSGDYYEAIELQQRQVERESGAIDKRSTLAGYQMMAGEYDAARESILRVLDFDPGNNFAVFNQALHDLVTGDTTRAVQTLQELVSSSAAEPSPEVIIMLASLTGIDETLASQIKDARIQLHRRLALNAAEASGYLWLAWLNLLELRQNGGSGPQVKTAGDLLEIAHLIESRAFYLGLLYLLEGKLADLRQDRESARQWYGRVLSNASSAFHQQEAAALLQTPYGNAP